MKMQKLRNWKMQKLPKLRRGGGGYENAKVIELETAKVTKQENTNVTEIDGGFMKMQKLQNWKMQATAKVTKQENAKVTEIDWGGLYENAKVTKLEKCKSY